MMRRTTALLTLLIVLPGPAALADSEGYFCTGDGYIAYELRWSGEVGGHSLTIVRFGKAIGIEQIGPIELEDFQTHGMVCGRDFIEIRAFKRSYFVDISDIQHPTLVEGDPAPEVTSDGLEGNLGILSKESVLELDPGAAGGRFQLVILKTSRRAHPREPGVEHFTVSQLIQRDSRQRVLARHHLFTGISLETVD